jgi:hypothetical protein
MLDLLGRLASSRFIDNPIFIVGGSRSGTVALLMAMGKHKHILSTPSEDPFITDVGGMVHALEYCSEVEKDYYLRTLRISHEYIYKSLRRLAMESALGKHYGLKQLVKQAVGSEGKLFQKRFWCTKTFPSELVAQGLLKLYPGTRFIWILRNGVNVVHSRRKFPEFRELSFENHCQHWAESIMRFSYLFRLSESIVVRQEELADDPDKIFRRIFNHIGISYDPRPTEFALTHLVHPLDDESTSTGVDVKKVLSERPPAYENWTVEQKSMFKDICGEAMSKAGYNLGF